MDRVILPLKMGLAWVLRARVDEGLAAPLQCRAEGFGCCTGYFTGQCTGLFNR
jgi:hypothetical protein